MEDHRPHCDLERGKMEMEIVKNSYWENAAVRVTIITPTFNRRNTLDRAIRSVEAQTYMEWEYIIVDDGSSDETYQLVKPFMENTNHPVMYIRKENGGCIPPEISVFNTPVGNC